MNKPIEQNRVAQQDKADIHNHKASVAPAGAMSDTVLKKAKAAHVEAGNDSNKAPPAQNGPSTQLHAVKPKDSQPVQQQQGNPSQEKSVSPWQKHVSAAKAVWEKLTEDEILKSEGHAHKLAALVRERYALKREDAEKQVKGFLETHALA